MKPLDAHIKDYKYAEMDKWSREEVSRFHAALLKSGKDFGRVAAQVSSKSSLQCVVFYYLWKKLCPVDYRRLRSVWKKRDSILTVQMLNGGESIIDNDDNGEDSSHNNNCRFDDNCNNHNAAQPNLVSLKSWFAQ